MHKVICDFCERDIRPTETHITVEIQMSTTILGSQWDCQELHFHTDCGTRLRNKVNAFIAEARERKENDDRSREK